MLKLGVEWFGLGGSELFLRYEKGMHLSDEDLWHQKASAWHRKSIEELCNAMGGSKPGTKPLNLCPWTLLALSGHEISLYFCKAGASSAQITAVYIKTPQNTVEMASCQKEVSTVHQALCTPSA